MTNCVPGKLLVFALFLSFSIAISQVGCGGTSSGGGGTGGTTGGTTGTPPPTDITAVNHILFMIQENRSFDHYFGRLNTYRTKLAQTEGWAAGPKDVDTLDALSATPSNEA